MAIARTPTLLALDRYAQIMGINPAHFNQAVGGATYMPVTNSCANVWYQEDWVNADQVSRESLAMVIHNAEMDIARELGWFPAPSWIAQDVRDFPRHYRKDAIRLGSWDVRGYTVGLRATYGKIISPGVRATELLGTPSTAGGLTYTDEDGDGFSETATVTLATTYTDVSEIKVYFEGHDGEPEWEIRPARTKTVSAGTFTATFWVWQFIEPSEWTAIPTTLGASAIDVTDTNNLVREVDVYLEWNDPTQSTATFFWEPLPNVGSVCASCGGAGCTLCQLTTQDGCLHIRDANLGIVVPYPATYDADTEAWTTTCYCINRAPDMVSLYYYSGNYDDRFLAGRTSEPLSDYWAQTIAWLATARLERPLCDCGASTALAEDLREDLALSASGRSHRVLFRTLDNPFGTRKGEAQAWERVRRTRGRLTTVGLA